MKLSEAIILGSLSTTQRFDPYGTEQALCVIQTAVYASGNGYIGDMYRELWKAWPWTANQQAIHPVTGRHVTITRILYSLNDSYRWPRPRIAEWVKTIEPIEVILLTQEAILVEATR